MWSGSGPLPSSPTSLTDCCHHHHPPPHHRHSEGPKRESGQHRRCWRPLFTDRERGGQRDTAGPFPGSWWLAGPPALTPLPAGASSTRPFLTAAPVPSAGSLPAAPPPPQPPLGSLPGFPQPGPALEQSCRRCPYSSWRKGSRPGEQGLSGGLSWFSAAAQGPDTGGGGPP